MHSSLEEPTRPSLWLSISVLALLGAAGCHSDGLSAQGAGYLANDVCAQNVTADSCVGAAPGCRWVELAAAETEPSLRCAAPPPTADAQLGAPTPIAPGCLAPPSSGACVSNDRCLALGKADCLDEDGECSWSAVRSLCPLGADCAEGGFCHRRDEGGTDCACVSPLACPMGAACAAVECDCSSGGGGGSGGACTCACPACAPGESCPPCACNCDDGGSGCTAPGTCVTSCTAPSVGCSGSQGDCAVSSDSGSCVTVCDGGSASVGVGSTGSSPTGSPTGSDASSANEPAPSPECGCACAPCASGALCESCGCDCGNNGGGGMKGCVGPPLPAPTEPGVSPMCPAIACANPCPNGYVKANLCDTCECL